MPPHEDLRCLQIQLFRSLVIKELLNQTVQHRYVASHGTNIATGLASEHLSYPAILTPDGAHPCLYLTGYLYLHIYPTAHRMTKI